MHKQNQPAAKPILAILILTLSTILLACEEPELTHSDASVSNDALTSDALTDVAILADSGPGKDAGVQYDICNQPLFKVPIDGYTQATASVGIERDYVFYSTTVPGMQPVDFRPHLLEINSCVLYLLSNTAVTGKMSAWDEEIIWTDNSNASQTPNYYCNDVFRFEKTSWNIEQLSDEPHCKFEPKTNGRFIVWQQWQSEQYGSLSDLILLDTSLNETVVIETNSRFSYYDIGDRFLVWSGLSDIQGAVGRDVLFRDLNTGETQVVDDSLGYYTYATYTASQYLTFMATEEYTTPPYLLVVADLETGQSQVVSENEYGIPFGYIDKNIIMWTTTEYTNAQNVRPADIGIFDINSGTKRRVTTRASNLRVEEVRLPYVVMVDILELPDITQNDYYVANLVDLGIIDADGNLVAGEGVLEPPR